jgi:hypothetical protein
MKYKHLFTIITIGIIASACSNSKDNDLHISLAKKLIETDLIDPSSVQYRNVVLYSEDVVCGEINAKNRMGGYTGFSPFIYNGDKLNKVKTENVFSTDLAQWCNNNPKKRVSYIDRTYAKSMKFCIVKVGKLTPSCSCKPHSRTTKLQSQVI